MATSAGNAFFTKLQIPTRTTGVINKVIDTNSEIDNKADITYVDAADAVLQSNINAKADTTTVDSTFIRLDATTATSIPSGGSGQVCIVDDTDSKLYKTNTLKTNTVIGDLEYGQYNVTNTNDSQVGMYLYNYGAIEIKTNVNNSVKHTMNSAIRFSSANTLFRIYVDDTQIDGNLDVTGSINNPSDARAKYNITEADYESAYNRIKLTPMHSFTYRHPRGDIPVEFGVVADELQQQFPDMVSIKTQDTEETEGAFKDANGDVIPDLKVINVSGMVQILASALKHAQTEIDSLKQAQTEIDSLKTLVSSLTDRITALEG